MRHPSTQVINELRRCTTSILHTSIYIKQNSQPSDPSRVYPYRHARGNHVKNVIPPPRRLPYGLGDQTHKLRSRRGSHGSWFMVAGTWCVLAHMRFLIDGANVASSSHIAKKDAVFNSKTRGARDSFVARIIH